jgi:hypothetical protein
MKTYSNNQIIASLLENIPKKLKPTIYLTELLQLSRESVYRRLRGEIPFTFQEVADIAKDLNVSIDNILFKGTNEWVSFRFISDDNHLSSFCLMLKKSAEKLENIIHAQQPEIILALNRLPPLLRVFNDTIFKFTYYKASFQTNLSFKKTFAELQLAPEVIALQKKIQSQLTRIDNSILILDPNIFLSMITDIKYYHQRRLISDEEVFLFKQEMQDLITSFENIAQSGYYNSNTKVYLYLSFLHINANSGYISYDHIEESLFWIFTTNPMLMVNRNFSQIQKEWLYSLKRQSTLITQSNEIFQADFFNNQRKFVDENLVI